MELSKKITTKKVETRLKTPESGQTVFTSMLAHTHNDHH